MKNTQIELKQYIALLFTVAVGAAIWFSPRPEALTPQAWHMLAIFIATVVGIVLKPFPMGVISLFALGFLSATHTLTIAQSLKGFSAKPIWIVVVAFFIARGFMKTRLGTRIAYLLVMAFGRRSLGLSYSFIMSELLLAPAIPSVTARSGGIIYPITNALCEAMDSRPYHPSSKNLGTFLILVCFQASVITSAMFLTAMAANPIVAELAAGLNVPISWGKWALAGIVPGLISLAVMPLVIYKMNPPLIKELPDAYKLASDKLKEMGPVKTSEWIMFGVFIFLLVLWILESVVGIDSVTTGFIGISILLITGVLNWDDLVSEKGAWSTLFWFGTLYNMADFLNTFGVIGYYSQLVAGQVDGFSWPMAFAILGVLYFFSHYFFASCSAHVSAMFTAFLSIAIALGTPPYFAGLTFAFMSSLFGGLTHYGIASGPVLFGSGFVGIKDWWVTGLLIGLLNLAIWIGIGGMWWKFLGYW